MDWLCCFVNFFTHLEGFECVCLEIPKIGNDIY
jgi:hypothetical protein